MTPTLICLRNLCNHCLEHGTQSLANIDPDKAAAKYGADPMLIRIVIGMICPENRECNV